MAMRRVGVVRTVESGRHSRRGFLPRRGGRRWGPFRDRRGPSARRQAAERETQTTGEEEAETAYGVDTGRGYEDLVQSLREAAESEDCEGVGALVPEVERTLEDLFARVKAKEGERSESAAATTSSSPDLLAQGDDGSVTDEEKIADLLAQVTEFDRADGESEVDSLKRMRRRVDALQRELVRQELKVVMRDVESNLEREERELDEFLGMEFGMEAQKLNYISVTFLTLGVASVAWACEQFLLGEDTSWWWSLPGGLSGARDWLLMVCPPVVIAGLTQLPALKPLVAKFDYLDEYLTQTFTYNADYLRLDEVDVAEPLPGDLDVSDYEEAGQGPLDPSSVPFATYLCFDTVIIGSEVSFFFFTERERERERNRGADNLAPRRPRQLIVALGFLEGLLLKGAGAYGWASQDEFAADTAAANALGGLVDTLPLNQFLIGPLVVLAVSALITSIDFQLNEIEKEEDALLSDLLYSPEAKTSELAQGRCSRFTFEL